jgi:acyl-CoA synthetase (NDP forming)
VSVETEKNEKISRAIAEALGRGQKVFNLEESRAIMELAGIPFNKCGLATSAGDAADIADDMGYPVVMKIVSPQVIHKTEVGGVRVNIATGAEVKSTYEDIVKGVLEQVPHAEINGILIEEMVSGTELIVGTTTDPQFGPMIMFGIGGIFVEVYKDVSFRLIPISANDARDMMGEIKGKALLEGIRGLPRADPDKIVEILENVSKLVQSHPEIDEMDINPLLITENGIIAVDARILLGDG